MVAWAVSSTDRKTPPTSSTHSSRRCRRTSSGSARCYERARANGRMDPRAGSTLNARRQRNCRQRRASREWGCVRHGRLPGRGACPTTAVVMRQLTKMLEIDASYITSITDGLANRATGSDRRVRHLKLTPQGVHVCDELLAYRSGRSGGPPFVCRKPLCASLDMMPK